MRRATIAAYIKAELCSDLSCGIVVTGLHAAAMIAAASNAIGRDVFFITYYYLIFIANYVDRVKSLTLYDV